MKPISVIVTAYNEEEYIRAALQSVINQTCFELLSKVIVVDDGSEDNTLKVAKELAEEHATVHVMTQLNQGLSVARNTGIRKSETEWICFLDADDKWAPNKIEEQWRAACEEPMPALWYTDTRMFGSDNRRIRVRDLPDQRREALVEYFRRDCPIIPSTVMVRRTVFQNVGMFNPELRFAQDTEMWARIIAEYRVSRIPEALVFRRVHSESHSSNVFAKLRYKKLVSSKLADRFPVLQEHREYRYARLQFSVAMRHLRRGNRSRAVLRARNALLSDKTVFEAYIVILCAFLAPRPKYVLSLAGRVRQWLQDVWSRLGA